MRRLNSAPALDVDRLGNLEVHWPEGTVLIGPNVDPDSLEPDYNALVSVEL